LFNEENLCEKRKKCCGVRYLLVEFISGKFYFCSPGYEDLVNLQLWAKLLASQRFRNNNI